MTERIIAELERRADCIGTRTEMRALYRALALALRNGGGCPRCHGKRGEEINCGKMGGSWYACPHCDGTGYDEPMRELLHSLGVEVE
jgi:hypothetical protein